MRGFVLLYIFIAVGFVAIAPVVFSSTWVSSSDFHCCIEIVSSFIALCAGIIGLLYFFGLKNRYFLIIGLAFIIAGSEDLAHGILSWNRLFAGMRVDFSRFIPATYVAGRTVLAVIIILAPFLETAVAKPVSQKKEAYIFGGMAILLGAGATVLAFTIPLPQFIFPERLISRPVDFVSAILFFIAFCVILKRYVTTRDIFSGMILASLLLNLGGQVYMSFSKQLHDLHFDVAHWANIFSYLTPVIGIGIQGLEEIKKSARELVRRKQAEESLRKSHAYLEAKVKERTSELAEANKGLQAEVADRKRVQEQLSRRMRQLEQFNRLAVGREQRMIELKREVNEMARKAGAAPPYDLGFVEDPEPAPGARME